MLNQEITKEHLFILLKKCYRLIPDGTENEDLIEIKKILFTSVAKIRKEVGLVNVENLVTECEHPFAYVQSKCNGEINHCLKCGKDL